MAAFGFDAYSPAEIARRVNEVGVAKAHLPLAATAMLGVLAGAFIALGSLYYTLVASDASREPVMDFSVRDERAGRAQC